MLCCVVLIYQSIYLAILVSPCKYSPTFSFIPSNSLSFFLVVSPCKYSLTFIFIPSTYFSFFLVVSASGCAGKIYRYGGRGETLSHTSFYLQTSHMYPLGYFLFFIKSLEKHFIKLNIASRILLHQNPWLVDI